MVTPLGTVKYYLCVTSQGPQTRQRGRPGGKSGAALLEAARHVFLDSGYAATTMDAVAAAARISKQTLYREHPSKEALYAAVVRDWVDRGYEAIRPHTTALAEATDVRTGLLQLAAVLHAGVLSAPVLKMRTLVTTEAAHLPDVAADYLARSWDRNQALLAEALERLTVRGLLLVEHAHNAAEQFTWLVLAAPLNRLSLRPDSPIPRAELERIANEAVTTLLSRYGPRPSTARTPD